ncbi:MAG TPA: glycosyltransferase family 39 protein [Vicinamibacterales bacterium]|nr:glycosyltransferase family 39 protein [Vicinamibacterales bacterium]
MHRVLLACLVAATVVVGVVWGTMAVGGSDSYGYVSQSELLLHGRITVPQPWAMNVPWPRGPATFTPLGYTRTEDETALAPTYPPGLPLLMATAKLIAGHCATFWVVPIAGGVLILATYGLGRRVLSRGPALAAAWLAATSPIVLFMVTAPMSDIPAAAAWATSLWLATARESRRPALTSVLAGVAAGVAVLIRPNLLPAAVPIVLWYGWTAWRDTQARRTNLLRGVLYGVGLSVGVLGQLAVNWLVHHSLIHTGYGPIEEVFSFANFPLNARHYATWFASTQTPLALAGLVALAVPAAWMWPQARDRSVVVLLGLFAADIWLQYCLYTPFDAWWYLRFLVPCWPVLMIGLAQALFRFFQADGRARLVPIVLAVVLGVNGVRVANDLNTFTAWLGESRYAAVAGIVRGVTEPQSIIFSMQHSGSIRYYSGRQTLNFVNLEDEWLDRAVAWLNEHGAHPYAALEEWEVAEFKRRFARDNAAGRLEMSPMFVYQGGATVYLYDLLQAPGMKESGIITEKGQHARCVKPAILEIPPFK